jgi:hypothetical protein
MQNSVFLQLITNEPLEKQIFWSLTAWWFGIFCCCCHFLNVSFSICIGSTLHLHYANTIIHCYISSSWNSAWHIVEAH